MGFVFDNRGFGVALGFWFNGCGVWCGVVTVWVGGVELLSCVCDGGFMLGFGMIVDGLRVGVDLFVWCGVGVGVVCVSGGGRVLVFVGFGVCVKGSLLDVGF